MLTDEGGGLTFGISWVKTRCPGSNPSEAATPYTNTLRNKNLPTPSPPRFVRLL